MDNKEIDRLLFDENEHLNKLHKIVKETLLAEELIVHNLLNPPSETLTPGQKISDKDKKMFFSISFYFYKFVYYC